MSLNSENTSNGARSFIMDATVTGMKFIYRSRDVEVDIEILMGESYNRYTIPIQRKFYEEAKLKLGDKINIEVSKSDTL